MPALACSCIVQPDPWRVVVPDPTCPVHVVAGIALDVWLGMTGAALADDGD